MQLVLVHHKDQQDIHTFSGTSYFMTQAIREEFGHTIEYSLPESEALLKGILTADFENSLKPYGRKLSDLLRKDGCKADFIVCLGGNTCIPFYDHDIPIIYWHDCTWHTLLQSYTDDSKFDYFRSAFKNLYLWDARTLQRADLAIFSSSFIAEACIKDYGVHESKLRVIPFGANFHIPPSEDTLQEALERRRKSKVLNLCFLGKDWKRKGLEDAHKLTVMLNAMGISTRLHIVGCEPELDMLRRYHKATIYGFLDKSDESHLDRMKEILKDAHFLIHPAVSEPYGIVLCEANAYGIPVIGTRVEGLQTIVKDGKNGFLFPPASVVKDAAMKIRSLFTNFEGSYAPLFHSSLNEFRTRLNWKASAKELKRVLSAYRRP